MSEEIEFQVFLFHGNDLALLRMAAADCIAAITTLHQLDELDVDAFDLTDAGQLQRALSSIRAAPLLSARRLVVWRRAERLIGGSQLQTALQLQEACSTALPTTILVVEAETDPQRKGTKADDKDPIAWADASLAALMQHAKRTSFFTPPPWKADAVDERIQSIAGHFGLKLGPGATSELTLRIGNDGELLYGAMRSLKAVVGNQLCTKVLVQQTITGVHVDVEAAVDRLLAGKKTEAMQLLAQVAESPLSSTEIVIRIQRAVLSKAVVRTTTNANSNLAADLVRCSTGQLYYRRQEVKSIRPAALKAALNTIAELDGYLSRGLPISKASLVLWFACSVLV